MNSSTNTPVKGAQHINTQHYNLLDGIQNFAGSDTLQNGEDLSRYFDPELFESTTIGNGFSQPSLSLAQDFESNATRQSNTPEIQQYSVPQQNFNHQHYSSSFYNPQQVAQSNYDPRFYQRPSASPVAFDGNYTYQPQMSFNPQSFSSQQMNITQRHATTPSQTYPQRQQQQQPSPFVNMAQRSSHMTHAQQTDLMRYGTFSVQDQPHQTSRFVDPSMLTATQTMNTGSGNGNTFHAQQSYMQAPYYKTGSTLDPRALHGLQPTQSLPPNKSLQPAVVVPKLAQPVMPASVQNPNVQQKKPRGRPRKDGTIRPNNNNAASSDSSDDELEIEAPDSPEITPAFLSVSEPTDERGRALYRAIQAVWSPRNRSVNPEKIRASIASFGETVRGLRDAWKIKNESLRKAELPNSATGADASRLKEEVAQYRQVVEAVMARSLHFGHPAIVKRLGGNQFTMSALSSFMLDRINVLDFDSDLTTSILKFVIKFETLDSEMLEMTKLSKILQRLSKKATGDIRSMAQTVLDNAATASARKAANGGDKKPASPSSVGSPADSTRKSGVAGVKRRPEDNAGAQPATKKVVKVIPQSSKPLAVRLEEKRKAEEAAAKRAKGSEKISSGPHAAGTAASTSTVTPAAKGKVAVAAPAKSSIFAALSSVPKKPGTSNAERAAAAAKEKTVPGATRTFIPARTVKEEPIPRAVSSTSVANGANSSSFLGVLLDMEKKPDKEVKKETIIHNETEEERAKRLRKEARRKLRVSWKADDVLVETRFFTHDPDEELEQGDRLKANAGGGREGEALKQHKEMDDLDDDEDEDSFEELEPYTPPSEVDFTDLEDASLGDDSPHKTNLLRFGGPLKPESRSKEAQDKYEQDALMTLYANKSDRPSTPKEIDDKEDDDFEPADETPFGEPPEQTRKRENEYVATRVRPQRPPAIDLNALAQAMAAQPRPQQQPVGITPELQRVLGMYSQPSQPAPVVPQATPAPAVNLQAILQSVLGQQAQPQQPQYPAATPAPAYNTDLSALLASMQQGTQAAPTANTLPVGMGANPNPYPGTFDDVSRKHGRTDSNGNDDEYGKKNGNKKKKGEAKPYNYKTQICTFWEQGKCLKGDSCTYRHGDQDD